MVMKLGRIPVFDERSRQFSVRRVVYETVEPRSQFWECPLTMDQGEMSACVGFSWCHQLASTPEQVQGITEQLAIDTYKHAQTIDDIPGERYEGTSVIAGVQSLLKRFPGVFQSYHWAFGLDDLVIALGYVGPVVLGINWYNSMFNPDSSGVIKVSGVNVGGHAILAIGVDIENEYIIMHNSWGFTWGQGGKCRIKFKDMNRLLHEKGEACVATGKRAFNIADIPAPLVPPKRPPKHIGAG